MKTALIMIFSLMTIRGICQTNDNFGGGTKNDSLKDPRLSSVGVYVGFNNSYNTKNGIEGNTAAYGISPLIGVYGQFYVSPKWQVEFGLGFMEYDAKYLRYGYSFRTYTTPDTTWYNDHIVTRARYVTVPITVKYNLTNHSTLLAGIRGSGQIGNSAIFLIGYRTGGVDNTNSNTLDNIDANIPYNQFDLGLILGYEYRFNDIFSASVLYNSGFIPIFPQYYINQKNNESPGYGETDYFYRIAAGNYNRSVSITLRYNFLVWGGSGYVNTGKWRYGHRHNKPGFPHI